MAEIKFRKTLLSVIMSAMTVSIAFADPTFDKLFNSGDFKAALDYADEKIGITDRDGALWAKIAQANSAIGMNEKALACYMVAARLNPNDYQALLGCATVYNSMNNSEEALNMAKKALEINFTAEASWEYAKACIALNRSAEAKSALEKVIQADPKNAIANRELGNIYFNEKEYVKAAPLLIKDYKKESDGMSVYKIGKAYLESSKTDSAMIFLKEAASKGVKAECQIELARGYSKLNNDKEAVLAYASVPKETLTASDLYNYATAKEKLGIIAEAVSLYESAISKSGNDTSKDALLAREKVARYRMQNKEYDPALRTLQFIVQNDAKGVVVPDGYFLLSDVYQATNETQNAIICLENVIKINPKNVEAYARLAELYQKANQPEKAKETLESMMLLSPNDPAIYLSLGKYNLKVKKYIDARAMFEKSNSLKASADASEGLAIAAFTTNQFPEAKAAALTAVKMKPELIESRIILANVFISEKNYADAQAHLEFVIQKRSEPEYLDMLAVCYLNNGQNDKLLEIDKKIVVVNSTNIESRNRLAKDAEQKKNFSEAIRLYKELLSINSDNSSTVFKLYELTNASNDAISATIYLKKYIALSPNNGDAHGLLGDLYYNDKKEDDALAEYRTALKLNASSKGFLKRYAEIVSAKGLQDEVISALSGLVTSGEADVSTYTTLGLIYEKKKMPQKAMEMYQNALKKEPSNVDALSAIAACQASTNDLNGAIISYEQVLMMNSSAVNEYKELGDLYMRTNKTAEAIKTYKTYLSKDSSNSEIIRLVGKNAYVNKEYVDVVRYLGLLRNRATDDDRFDYADALVNVGDSIKAITELELLRSSKFKPAKQAMVLSMLADMYEKANRVSDAVKVLGELVALPGGKDPDKMYKRAFLSEKDNRAGAIKYYEENTRLFPGDYRNFLRIGVLLSENRETMPKAVECLKRVTELGASVPTVWLELGKVYAKQNKDSDAIIAFKRYAENDPQSLEVNRNLGILLLKTGKVNESMVYLEIANTFQPGDPVVMANLAKGYLQTGRNSEAMDLLVKVKDKAADNIDVRLALFEIYLKNGQKENAFTEIKAVVDKTNEPKYILIYAKALLDDGKTAEALDAIENILAVDAENIDALMVKAMSLRVDKKYDEAIEIYKEVSFIQTDYAPSFFERAETHLQQNKFQWAETYYKRTLETDPKYALAELGLAKIAKVRKDDAGYKLHLDNANKIDPENVVIKEEIAKNR